MQSSQYAPLFCCNHLPRRSSIVTAASLVASRMRPGAPQLSVRRFPNISLSLIRVVLSILDWRCIALPPLKRRCKAGGSWYPRRTCPFDFLYLRPFIFAASAVHGIQPVEGCCHSQSKKWTIAPTAPPSLGPNQSQHHGWYEIRTRPASRSL